MVEAIFVVGVAAFVLLLALTFRAGSTRSRRRHLWLSGAAFAVMFGLIYWVEKLVHGRSYDPMVFRTHMACVAITLLMVAGLAILGTLLARKVPVRRFHRAVAWFFISSLVPTVATGVWLYVTLG